MCIDCIIVEKSKTGPSLRDSRVALASSLPSNVMHRILHHESRSHYMLQVADYCCWAVFRKWERGDTAHYDLIAPAMRSEFDIFRTGTRHHY